MCNRTSGDRVRKIGRLKASVIASLLIGACAAALAQPASPKRPPAAALSPPAGPCLGVLSDLGDKLSVRKVGITVFGNEDNSAAISSWGIDDLAVSTVAAAAGKRFATRRIAFPKAAYEALANKGIFEGLTLEEDIRTIVRSATASVGCDRYALIVKTSSQLGNSNQGIRGLGILEASSLVQHNVSVFALTAISIYDGRTYQVLHEGRASMGQSTLFASIRGPHRDVDESWWPATPEAASGDARLKGAVRELVAKSLAMTMPEMLTAQ